jgi:DNA polymerase-3 subunit delta
MRFYPKGFSSVIDKIQNSSIKGVLLYGPDKGMIEHFMSLVKQALSLNMRKVDYAEANKSSLAQIFNTLNLFDSREIIVINNFSTSLDKEGKQAFDNPIHNFPILVADELPTNSSLRQFFEKHTNLAAIACYSDLKADLKSIAVEYLKKMGKSIATDALDYVCDNINTDRKFLYSELDKLSIYANDKKSISLDDAQKSLITLKSLSTDKMCAYFASKDSNYFYELDNLFDNNTAEMLLIRSLIRYYTNMYIVKLRVSNGINVDEALKLLSPPIFFMQVSQFKVVVEQNTIPEILGTLKQLTLSEALLKSSAKNSRSIFENIFYQRG